MIPKVIDLPERFHTGEPTLSVVARDYKGKWLSEKSAGYTEKTASPAYDYIKSVNPEPGNTIILVNAVAAFETYDDNRNGDGFPARPYMVGHRAKCGHAKCSDHLDGWISPEEVLTKHYESFDKFGQVYRHHNNKNPLKSFGEVMKSFWNDRMQRVELLLRLVNSKSPELIEQINDGVYPAVSMGCVTAGTRITLGDGRRKNIEDVTIGDEVTTHKGRSRKVFQLHQRVYKGTTYSVKPEAAKEIHATHEHPFLVVEAKQVRKYRKDKGYWVWSDEAKVIPTWKLAEELRVSEHYLLQPIDRRVHTPQHVTKEFARLVGYYLAEGSLRYDRKGNVSAFELNCHRDDELLKEINNLTDALNLHRGRIYVRKYSALARNIVVNGRAMAETLRDLCGEGAKAKEKFLASSVLLWDPQLQLELLGAYANGDGHGTPKGSLTLSTGSQTLAEQWLHLLPRLGLLGCMSTLKHKAGGGFNFHETTEYVVNIGAQYAQKLTNVCCKVLPRQPKVKKESRKIIGDFVVTPIRRINAKAAEVAVYNFEVTEDNTYVTNGMVSHNCHVRWDVCSVCGHRAETRSQYCEHVDMDMRKIDPITGKRHCVLNPSPRFFDISIVRRPAETTGYMLKKVAHGSWSGWRESIDRSEKIANLERKQASIRKLSDIQKELVGDVLSKKSVPDLELFRKYRNEVLPGTAEAFEPAPDSTLMSMAEHGMPTAIATATEKSAALTCQEFVRLCFMAEKVALHDEHLLRVTAAQPLVMEVLAQYPDLLDEAQNVLRSKPSSALGVKIDEWAEKRATIGEWLRQKLHDTGLPVIGRGAAIGPGYMHGAREPAKTDLLTMTDPNTGTVQRTTRGAAQAAADQNYRSLLGKAVLMHGAYSMGMGMPAVVAMPLAYQSSKAMHGALHPYYGVSYQTDQGPVLAGNTEFAKTSSAKVTASSVLNKLALDYLEVSPNGETGVLALLAKSAGGSRLVAAFSRENMRAKVALLLSAEEQDAEDPQDSPTVSLSDCSNKLGALLVA